MKKIINLLAVFVLAAASLFSLTSVSAQEKVKVTFWHAMNGPHQEAITELVKQFNESQDQYEVVEQNQGEYDTLNQKVLGAWYPMNYRPCLN
ncbi:hypothetical protein [Ignavigranum ruoffiae]|uniref:hypothetical protein n=1 Tax=Ignavigranum ruoffiae TaxID=89093 RepID=UPI0024AD2B0D|nr:hypothetical protein [Ignavigranum ruoffiae]